MPIVQPIKALYYPRTQFGSIGWLKSALLYWEGILRIVPDGFMPWDPPEVHELAEVGLIEDISPATYRSRATDRFGGRLDDLMDRPGVVWPCETPQSTTLIHIGKMDPRLLHELKMRGVAAGGQEWASLPTEIAMLYEMTLADEAGQGMHAAPATDDGSCDVAAMYFAQRTLAPSPSAMAPVDGFACARSLAPFAGIASDGRLQTEKLLNLREKFSKQRRAFREKVQARVTAVADLPSVEAIRSHLTDFRREIEAELAAERRAEQASRVTDAWRIVRISAPATVGTAVSVAGAPAMIAGFGIAGSMGVGLVDWIVARRQSRRRTDAHYLLLLRRALTGRA